MLWPAFVSLLWAAIGAALTWVSTRNRSRTLWSLGAVLLVAAAAKLILLDFGSLGQIGNIIAMMAAGGVFLLVAWLAPFPPRPEHEPTRQPAAHATPSAAQKPPPRPSAPHRDASDMSRGWIWILVVVIAILAYGRWVQHERAHERSEAFIAPAPAPTQVVQPPVPMRNTAVASAGAVPMTQASRGYDACQQFAARIPADYLLYVVGTAPRFGRRRGSEIDPQPPGTSDSRSISVQINDGEKNVILALGTDAPTSVNLELPGAGRVVGVILSGNRHSEVTGISRSVPVLHAAAEDKVQCGFFLLQPGTLQGANQFFIGLLAHSVDGTFNAFGDRVTVGAEQGAEPGAADTPVRSAPAYILSALYMSPRNGRSLDVTGQIRSQCDGQVNCQVNCGNHLAGDPDFGSPKQCELEFKCDTRSTHVLRVRQGGRAILSCP